MCGDMTSDSSNYIERRKEADEFYFLRREIRERERWCWQFNEYNFTMKFIPIIVRLIHRKILFSLSGWLARAGKKKRSGK
jgi:hypothetical protein